MKKILIFAITITIFGGLSTLASAGIEKAELFISESCQFCNNVKEYVVENEITQDANFEYIDIGTEQGRALYDQRIIECEIPDYDQGVPMIYSYEDCRVTEGSVKDELDKRAGINDYETDDSGQTLAEILDSEEAPLPSAWLVLTMLAVPVTIVTAAWLLIKRFKL